MLVPSLSPGKAAVQPFALENHESRLIDCARVLCIFFMMFTHLKEYEGSIVYGGDLNAIGVLTNDYLGRASVPALSLVSGYLLAAGINRKRNLSVLGFAEKKTKSVLVPMLIWNLIYIGTVVAAYLTVGHSHRVIEIFREGSALDIVNAFAALTDTPANFSLYFIRDFFVTQVLLFALLRWGGGARIPLLIGIAACSTVGQYDPIISREMIVLFASLGALLALAGWNLIALASSRTVQIITLALLFGFFLWGDSGIRAATTVQFSEILMRVTMSLMILIVAYYLAQTPVSSTFHALAPIAFLTYLLHLPVTSMMWVLWSKLIEGGNDGYAYAAYYLCAPAVAWLVAIGLAAPLRRGPQLSGMFGLKG